MPTLPARHVSFLIVALLGGTALFGGCGKSSGEGRAQDLDVRNPRLVQTPSGERSFAGTLVNQGTERISIAEVEVALYDGNGTQTETLRIEVEDIPAQDSASFSGVIDSDVSFQQAQVKSVLVP